MMSIIIIIAIILVIGFIAGGIIWAVREDSKEEINSGILAKQAKEKREHKQKILDLLAGEDKISNSEVGKMLVVSDSTVVRYMDELETQGLAKQVGKTGRDVFYQKP